MNDAIPAHDRDALTLRITDIRVGRIAALAGIDNPVPAIRNLAALIAEVGAPGRLRRIASLTRVDDSIAAGEEVAVAVTLQSIGALLRRIALLSRSDRTVAAASRLAVGSKYSIRRSSGTPFLRRWGPCSHPNAVAMMQTAEERDSSDWSSLWRPRRG